MSSLVSSAALEVRQIVNRTMDLLADSGDQLVFIAMLENIVADERVAFDGRRYCDSLDLDGVKEPTDLYEETGEAGA